MKQFGLGDATIQRRERTRKKGAGTMVGEKQAFRAHLEKTLTVAASESRRTRFTMGAQFNAVLEYEVGSLRELISRVHGATLSEAALRQALQVGGADVREVSNFAPSLPNAKEFVVPGTKYHVKLLPTTLALLQSACAIVFASQGAGGAATAALSIADALQKLQDATRQLDDSEHCLYRAVTRAGTALGNGLRSRFPTTSEVGSALDAGDPPCAESQCTYHSASQVGGARDIPASLARLAEAGVIRRFDSDQWWPVL